MAGARKLEEVRKVREARLSDTCCTFVDRNAVCNVNVAVGAKLRTGSLPPLCGKNHMIFFSTIYLPCDTLLDSDQLAIRGS